MLRIKRKPKLEQHKKHAANEVLGYLEAALSSPCNTLLHPCCKNLNWKKKKQPDLHLLSSYCSHRPLAPLLARQSCLAAKQHSLPEQGEGSAPPCQQQREGGAEARSWRLVQLSSSNFMMPDFCLPGQWDGSSNGLGMQLPFLQGRSP